MWIFLPGGLLMPAAFPADKVDEKYLGPEADYDLQIRARVESHLTNFIRDYMPEDSYSEIQKTPEMDYNFRFYCRAEVFAEAMKAAVMDIDYLKFKPTAEDKYEDGTVKYADGKKYHSVLNSIWGTVCRLGSPGGVWAKGPYKPRPYTGSYLSTETYKNRIEDRFLAEDVASLGNLADFDDLDWYSPSEERRQSIFDKVEGLPASEWADYLSDEEIGLIDDVYSDLMEEEETSRRKKKRGISIRKARRAKKSLTKR